MDIIIQSGPEYGRRFTIQGIDAIIGRRSRCDISLRDERLSGQHARLYCKNGHWYVCDLNSSNGTWVNRQQIYQEHRLQPGDEVGVGKTVLRFENLAIVEPVAIPYPMYDANVASYNNAPSAIADEKSNRSGEMRVLPWFLLLVAGLFMFGGVYIFELSYRWEWADKLDLWKYSPILGVLGLLLIFPWGILGVLGGVNMTIKKFRGTSWDMWWLLIFLFGLIPIALWFIFLAFTGILGVQAWNASVTMLPSKRRCAQCRGWSDYAATRCKHCGQPLS